MGILTPQLESYNWPGLVFRTSSISGGSVARDPQPRLDHLCVPLTPSRPGPVSALAERISNARVLSPSTEAGCDCEPPEMFYLIVHVRFQTRAFPQQASEMLRGSCPCGARLSTSVGTRRPPKGKLKTPGP